MIRGGVYSAMGPSSSRNANQHRGLKGAVSQERKRHINIHKFSGACPGGGGSPDRVARGLPTGGQETKVYVLCADPKEHKHFRPGTRPGGSGAQPGGSVTGVTEKLFMCQMFMCLFWPLVSLIDGLFSDLNGPFHRIRLSVSLSYAIISWKPFHLEKAYSIPNSDPTPHPPQIY